MRKSEDVTGVDLASMFSAFFLRFSRRPFGYLCCIKELITYETSVSKNSGLQILSGRRKKPITTPDFVLLLWAE